MNLDDIQREFYQRMAAYYLGTADGYPIRIIPAGENGTDQFKIAFESQKAVNFDYRGPDGEIHSGSIQAVEEIPKVRMANLQTSREDKAQPSFAAAGTHGEGILGATKATSPGPGGKISFLINAPNLSLDLYELIEIHLRSDADSAIATIEVKKTGSGWKFEVEEKYVKRFINPGEKDKFFLIIKRKVTGVPSDTEVKVVEKIQLKKTNTTYTPSEQKRKREILEINGEDQDWEHLSRDEKAERLIPIASARDKEIRMGGMDQKMGNWALEELFDVFRYHQEELTDYWVKTFVKAREIG
jgi:hypothetical protein